LGSNSCSWYDKIIVKTSTWDQRLPITKLFGIRVKSSKQNRYLFMDMIGYDMDMDLFLVYI